VLTAGTVSVRVSAIAEPVALSDLVKASEEDIEWLYGEKPPQAIMRTWLALGPAMVVITRGPWGAWATRPRQSSAPAEEFF
jgi:fructokinase